MATYCPSASLYTYNILQSTNNKEDSDCNTTKLTNIICETFFINNNPDIELTEQKSTDLFAPFYFKQRIHSTPYITLIDPPPIQSGSLF
ncbi:hypothetical protein [Myroides pelagicus]|uniref:Uncharacterized protein n=1 Tax=Myroides pelagicus TaxID=270914 RepID=A0A7K1GJE3_9FLAO|nr:hypothetical protein [Myroides pelagicus]MEC4112990.1 hypothetical protein [Myroides pelagicus]MTH29007.1 hypothetical protein [Myroides pelagicus]